MNRRAMYFAVLLVLLPLQSFEQTTDAPMLLVPAGEHYLGRNGMNPDEAPEHEIRMDAFYLDQYEVTLCDFLEFLNLIGDHKTGCAGHRCTLVHSENGNSLITLRDDVYSTANKYLDHPATFVSWYGADMYCRWLGKRLPTEAEWESAARNKGSIFPWGDQTKDERAVAGTMPFEQMVHTRPVGSIEKGKSVYGMYDMAGNVMEWVDEWYAPDCYQSHARENPRCQPTKKQARVLRGGSFFNSINGATTINRYHDLPEHAQWNYGFRCAKNAP